MAGRCATVIVVGGASRLPVQPWRPADGDREWLDPSDRRATAVRSATSWRSR